MISKNTSWSKSNNILLVFYFSQNFYFVKNICILYKTTPKIFGFSKSQKYFCTNLHFLDDYIAFKQLLLVSELIIQRLLVFFHASTQKLAYRAPRTSNHGYHKNIILILLTQRILAYYTTQIRQRISTTIDSAASQIHHLTQISQANTQTNTQTHTHTTTRIIDLQP